MVFVSFHIFNLTVTIMGQTKQIEQLSTAEDSLAAKLDTLQRDNKKLSGYLGYVFNNKAQLVSVTGYHPVEAQCDIDPDVTADGTRINVDIAGDYRYVALSRDLLVRWGGPFRYGDYILIKGTKAGASDGIYQIRDTMNPRFTNWVDILLTPGDDSFYERNILMYKIDNEFAMLATFNLYPEAILN